MTSHGLLVLFLSLFFFSALRVKKEMIEGITLSFWALIEGHSNMTTCAVEIRQLGINRLHFKSFKVISGMSQRLSPKRPLCCPQPSLFTVRLNCSLSFNKVQMEGKTTPL